MEQNNHLSDSLKKVTISSMMTYLAKMSIENIENIIKWAKSSKNPNTNINTNSPSEWEKNLKTMFYQFTPQEQAEIIAQATKMLNDKKSRKSR